MATPLAETNGYYEANGTSNGHAKPLLELYVKASGIDSRRIGACIFCQEFWMELYALYEVGFFSFRSSTDLHERSLMKYIYIF